MIFNINKELFDKYPEVILGVIRVYGVNNTGNNPEITALLRQQESAIRERYADSIITEIPEIAAWREAYRAFGAKPKDYPSSVENLIRRVTKGTELRSINKLVDIYNYISLKYVIPVGGEDLSKVEGNIDLTFASANEKSIILLGEFEARPPYANEVIYKDNNGAICRRWNWKEADRTKLTEETTDVELVIEGLPPADKLRIQEATQELAQLVQRFCGGTTSVKILDKNDYQFQLK